MIRPHPLLALLLGLSMFFANTSVAGEERHKVKENGLVRFKASTSGITRISVLGDRIASIINDDEASLYQVKNDEKTGDIFLRYVGPEEMPAKEGGYLVTEQNRTLAFEILPIKASTQTILITLVGVEPPAEVTARNEGFAGAEIGPGDGLAAQLSETTREVIRRAIHKPVPTSGRNGALIRTLRVGDMTGEIRVAAAGKSPRQIREQEFYRPGVLSVWVQKTALAAGERSWVVVVRNR